MTELNFDKGIITVSPVQLLLGDKLSCRILSPARLLQWVGLDAHRVQNLKPCHQYVGKPECSTCPEIPE